MAANNRPPPDHLNSFTPVYSTTTFQGLPASRHAISAAHRDSPGHTGSPNGSRRSPAALGNSRQPSMALGCSRQHPAVFSVSLRSSAVIGSSGSLRRLSPILGSHRQLRQPSILGVPHTRQQTPVTSTPRAVPPNSNPPRTRHPAQPTPQDRSSTQPHMPATPEARPSGSQLTRAEIISG